MAQTITLIPKRKLLSALSSQGETVDPSSVSTIVNTITNNTGIPEIVDRLHVVKRLRIPVGTDCYDV